MKPTIAAAAAEVLAAAIHLERRSHLLIIFLPLVLCHRRISKQRALTHPL
jgi:hypothetical protein